MTTIKFNDKLTDKDIRKVVPQRLMMDVEEALRDRAKRLRQDITDAKESMGKMVLVMGTNAPYPDPTATMGVPISPPPRIVALWSDFEERAEALDRLAAVVQDAVE